VPYLDGMNCCCEERELRCVNLMSDELQNQYNGPPTAIASSAVIMQIL
jgi:hypothetical protein